MLFSADWLPMVLPVTVPTAARPEPPMAENGAPLLFPLEPPDMAMPAMVLPCTLLAVVAPTAKLMGLNLSVEPAGKTRV